MLLATTIVAVAPLVLSLTLRASGVISSGWLSVALAVSLSLGASSAGNAYWRKRGRAGEVLFGDLLLWGWLRRRHQERELANVTRLLDLASRRGAETPGPCADSHHGTLTVERRGHLLRELAGALEGQDVYLNGHSRRVARHATMIARGMGLPSEEVARVRAAAAVHDVGKLLTPKAMLNKPDPLTDAEFEVIKRHPVDGAEMVAALGDPELTLIVRHHHERLDGTAYPDRLTGDRIPVGARIIAVADTFDATTSARPYRAAAPHQKAIDILRHEAGTQLDPDAVRAFLAYYSGSRPTVVWAVIASFLRRLVAWLSGDPAAAATLSAGKMASAAAAAAAIGAAAGATPVPALHPPVRSVTAAHSAPARPGTALLAGRRHGASAAAALVHWTPTGPAANPGVPSRGPYADAHAKAPPRRPSHRAADHGAVHNAHQPNATAPRAGRPGGRAGAGKPGASGDSSAGESTRPSSINRAGHVNHASRTGAAARNGEHPHPTPPGHVTTNNGNGYANGHSKSHVNSHGRGSGNGRASGNATPHPGAHHPASPAASGPGNAGARGYAGGWRSAGGPTYQRNGGAPGAANGDTPGTGTSHRTGQTPDGGTPPGNGNGQGNGRATGQGNGHGDPTASPTPGIADQSPGAALSPGN